MRMNIEEMPRDFPFSRVPCNHRMHTPHPSITPCHFATFPSSNLKSDCTIEFPVLKLV
jgi:hypothetical protein